MKKMILAAAAVAAVSTAVPAAAQSTGANASANASARLIKPLALAKLEDLNFGTIVMGTIASDQVVSVSGTSIACGDGTALTCTGAVTSAAFRITGTQGQTVNISVPASIQLTNGGTGTLNFVPAYPASLVLGNSGAPGNTFDVGGSVTIDGNTEDGVYSGQINVTVDY